MGVDDEFPQTYDYLKSKDQIKREQEARLREKEDARKRSEEKPRGKPKS